MRCWGLHSLDEEAKFMKVWEAVGEDINMSESPAPAALAKVKGGCCHRRSVFLRNQSSWSGRGSGFGDSSPGVTSRFLHGCHGACEKLGRAIIWLVSWLSWTLSPGMVTGSYPSLFSSGVLQNFSFFPLTLSMLVSFLIESRLLLLCLRSHLDSETSDSGLLTTIYAKVDQKPWISLK